MKRLKFILIIILVQCSINSAGQDFYLFGGTNLSTIRKVKSNDNTERQKELGFQVGTMIDIQLTDKVFFSPRPSFVRKKEETNTRITFDYISGVDNIEMESHYNNYYIDLPLAFKYNFSVKNFHIHPFAGPYVSLLLFNNSSTETHNNGVHWEPEYQFKEKFINNIDYGLTTGVGINYHSFLINLAVDLGMYRELKYEYLDLGEKYKNTVFKLSLGYKI